MLLNLELKLSGCKISGFLNNKGSKAYKKGLKTEFRQYSNPFVIVFCPSLHHFLMG